MIVIGVILALKGVPRLRDVYAGERQHAGEMQARAARAAKAVANQRKLRDSLTARNAVLSVARAQGFTGGSANALSAAVASYVTQTARAAAVDLVAMQVRPDTSAINDTRLVVVTASARGDVAGLMHLLSSLEGGAKRFRVVSVAVSQPDIGARPDVPESLSIELALITFAVERTQ